MPLLSVRIIKRPRKIRTCEVCFRDITGEQVRLYGMADVGDKPYMTFIHQTCAGNVTAAALQALKCKGK
jgi:hypothetical protein